MKTKIVRKICRRDGFSLPEVMIAIFVLTVAIVAATNLLVSLMTTNQTNLKSLQAYYFAQEGLEGVRNIRDTNWLHNQEWLAGADEGRFWGATLAVPDVGMPPKYYVVNWEKRAFAQQGPDNQEILGSRVQEVQANRPWTVTEFNGDPSFDNLPPIREVRVAAGGLYFSGAAVVGPQVVDSGFRRVISLEGYDCSVVTGSGDCREDEVDDFVLVKSEVFFEIAGSEKSLVLTEVLSNWKSGAV
jgi:prepilin-type N-terminal cleavage/methylation domain-containing protein